MVRAGEATAQRIREAAADLFFEKGYHATSLREVAAACGLKVGSLYNHIASKEELLLQVMGGTMDDLLALTEEALAGRTDPVDRLRAAVDSHVRFHAERAREVHIGSTNLRALTGAAHDEIVAKRTRYERVIGALVAEVGEAGEGSVIDVRLHTYSILAQGASVAGWYRPEGRLDLDEIARAYTTFALRELGVPEADRRVEAAFVPLAG